MLLLLRLQDSKDVPVDSGIRHRHQWRKRKMPRLLLRHIHISTLATHIYIYIYMRRLTTGTRSKKWRR